jgi:hypothetical protein
MAKRSTNSCPLPVVGLSIHALDIRRMGAARLYSAMQQTTQVSGTAASLLTTVEKKTKSVTALLLVMEQEALIVTPHRKSRLLFARSLKSRLESLNCKAKPIRVAASVDWNLLTKAQSIMVMVLSVPTTGAYRGEIQAIKQTKKLLRQVS